jgi:UDP-N-acetylmuramate--alanine ligase
MMEMRTVSQTARGRASATPTLDAHIDSLVGIEAVHIVGIGGAGMSAIARVLHGRGLRVQGSDRRDSPITQALRAEGIPAAVGHAAEQVGVVDLVLASSAVPDDNPELVAARDRGIRVARRPDFLPALTSGYDVIAIAGAHGKTTVTGMIASVLLAAGCDPSYIVGGVVTNLETNGHAGKGRYFVIEADEYRRTFLALRPQIAVVTNVEFDHPDCYADLKHLRLAFGDFVDNVVPDGLLVACADDTIARAIAAAHHASGGRVSLYGLDASLDAAWSARDVTQNATGGMSFTVMHRGAVALRDAVDLRIPGVFNVANALAALSVAHAVGVDLSLACETLSEFVGTARRFEVLGEAGGVTVIDDYAHHPTQIRGVLDAARRRFPGQRLIAVWEPHTFSRIRALHDDFIEAFEAADELVIMPIYAAREVNDGSLTARDLARDLASGRDHPSVYAADSLDAAVAQLIAICEPGDVVMMMGAGNETIAGRKLIAQLATPRQIEADEA